MDRLAELGAIERFICERGLTECPPAHAAPSQQSEPKAELHLPLMQRDYRTGKWRRPTA